MLPWLPNIRLIGKSFFISKLIFYSWIASPACTELEMVTLDWLGKMLNLPKEFLFESKGHGGGVIQVKKISQYSTKYQCVRELLVKLR